MVMLRMNEKEKQLLIKAIKTFIKNDLIEKYFSKRIYNYLHINLNFIAHYSISGFYNHYFTNLNSLLIFINKLKEYNNPTTNTIVKMIRIHLGDY